MALTRITLFAFAVASVASFCDAKAFLQASEDNLIKREDVERALSELMSLSNSERVRSIQVELRPMYEALPKNQYGSLEQSTVRYAMHRYFVQKHGWYMAGFDPNGGAWNSTAPASLMKDRAPALIQNLFEQRVQGKGLHLEELSVFAAVMTDLVHKEASQELLKVYAALRLPTGGEPVPQRWSEQALKAYLVQILIGGNLTFTSMADFDFLEQHLPEIYPDWEGTYLWANDLRQSHNLMRQPRRNPFVVQRESFDTSVAFVQELGHHFGSFQNLECKALKGRLVDMEYQGTGRIRLSRFYAGGVTGDWTESSESVAYLRNLGVLDESDPSKPSVVIPNYVTSRSNCLTASGFYSVCCLEECGGLMQQLERDIASPSAAPSRIAELVSQMHSDTVDAPRNLSATLITRLGEIAEHHGGHVPLHGRLFAQWMHHAYPRECPFPHVTGTTNPMSPDEWMDEHGIDSLEASMEEMQSHHARFEAEHPEGDEEEDVALPWTHVEELVSGHHGPGPARRGSWTSAFLRCTMAAAALVSFAVPLVRGSRIALSSSTEAEKCFV